MRRDPERAALPSIMEFSVTKTFDAVFDAATDNACFEFPPITEIPAVKTAARAALALAMANSDVRITVCAPQPAESRDQPECEDVDTGSAPENNDATPLTAVASKPRMAFRGEWIGDEFFPETSQARLDKEEVTGKKERETSAIRRITTMIAKRQAIGDGWSGRAANDNHEPLPLITALVRDGRDDEVAIIRRYRYLADVVGTSPFGDTVMAGTGDGVEVAVRTGFPDQAREVAEAADGNWKSLPEGDLVQHEVRQTTKQKLSFGSRCKPANDNSASAAVPLSLGYGEDAMIARMDGEPILRQLRAALGPLLGVFEDAALDGATFTAIGEARGYSGKQASAAGRALVYAGVDVVSTTLCDIDKRRKDSARSAHEAVKRRRAELAAQRALNFGLSA